MDATTFTTWAEFEEKIGGRLAELQQALGNRRMVALLIGRDNTELMKTKIIPSLEYLDGRSLDAIDFYLIGWKMRQEAGGYLSGPGPMRAPDPAKGMKKTVEFNASEFNKTIDILERYLKWTYSEELDLILFEGIVMDTGVQLDFSNAVNIQLTFRQKDGTISSIDSFIGGIIDFAKNTKSDSPVRTYLTQRLANIGIGGIYDGVVDLFPKQLRRFIRSISRIVPKDLSSNELKSVNVRKVRVSTGLQM